MTCDAVSPRPVASYAEARSRALCFLEAEVCQDCGERYFHARTLDKIDAIIEGDHEVKQLLSVEVLTAYRDPMGPTRTIVRGEDQGS
jgi:hypothetical protein